jgi:hypothetical protein
MTIVIVVVIPVVITSSRPRSVCTLRPFSLPPCFSWVIARQTRPSTVLTVSTTGICSLPEKSEMHTDSDYD